MKGAANGRVRDLLEMFDGIPSLEKIRRNELAMALGCMLLRAHQAKGRGDLPQAHGQYISGVIPQSPIVLTPILTVYKEVPELYCRHVRNVGTSQYGLDAFICGLSSDVCPHTGPVRPQAHVHYERNVCLLKQRYKVTWGAPSIADGICAHR
jgi:hypothetical protein